jgi:poly(A) polymerase
MFFFSRNKNKPLIVPRNEHTLSRRDIDSDALKVLYRLSSLSHEAYLVGGSVRDLLLGRKPKDFDVGTDARPNEIKRIFRNCFLVGRRFRLAHIVFGKKVIETATFRKAPDANAVQDEHGLYQYEDNTFGTPCEDANRRDFTVNGLFYDIKTFAIIDYVGGLKDLKNKVIRSIGDPAIRFREDPVRMMRAVRFAAKLDFTIASSDRKAMKRYASELSNASLSRLAEEIMRLFVKGATKRSIQLAYEGRLLHTLLPSFAKWLDADRANVAATWRTLDALDQLSKTMEVTPAVAFTALYWTKIKSHLPEKPKGQNRRVNERYQRRLAAQEVISSVVKHYRLPRAVWMTAVDMIELTPRFLNPPQKTRRDIRFATYGVFNVALQWGALMAILEPEKKWHLEAWKAFAIQCERERRGNISEETAEAVLEGKPNVHTRKRRRKSRKRRHEAKATDAQTPTPEVVEQ